MRILLDLENEEWVPDVSRMVRLFMEDAVILREPSASYDTVIRARITGVMEQAVLAEAEWLPPGEQRPRRMTASRVLEETGGAVLLRKRGKQAVLRAVHDVLAASGGEGQPWGILTGVRPLKLVHSMREKGYSWNRIRQELAKEYAISASRIALLLEIAKRQLCALPHFDSLDREVSVYIGIPFCPTHCAYCTFPAYSMREKALFADDFLGALEKELAHVGRWIREANVPVTSVYVGGGTPTSLGATELERLFTAILREIPGPATWREFNVEAGRPDTITPDRVDVMRRYGVNRISVNPQTFKASTLKMIGRGHSPDLVEKRFYLCREAGFKNINMDIILGLPGETMDDVRHTLERIALLAPDAVTVHTMSFKTTAVIKNERERFPIPRGQMVRAMMEEAQNWLRQMGQSPYYVYRQKDILGNMENVGYSLPGKEGIYNICIMEERQSILGVGGGASTKLIGPGGTHLGLMHNAREPKAYVDGLSAMLEKKEALLRKWLAARAVVT
jgi:oxygen-independent coproporphyrinogen-3 oxidase